MKINTVEELETFLGLLRKSGVENAEFSTDEAGFIVGLKCTLRPAPVEAPTQEPAARLAPPNAEELRATAPPAGLGLVGLGFGPGGRF